MIRQKIIAFAMGTGLLLAALAGYFLVASPSGPDISVPKELLAFQKAERGTKLPATRFKTEDGRDLTLGDFEGKVLVVNLWATWCAPCLEEMPALDLLKRDMAGKPVDVLAISMDTEGPEAVRGFFDAHDISHLDLYIDETMALYSEAAAAGLPMTLIVSPEGDVLGHLFGTAEWDAPRVQSFLLQLAVD